LTVWSVKVNHTNSLGRRISDQGTVGKKKVHNFDEINKGRVFKNGHKSIDDLAAGAREGGGGRHGSRQRRRHLLSRSQISGLSGAAHTDAVFPNERMPLLFYVDDLFEDMNFKLNPRYQLTSLIREDISSVPTCSLKV